MRTVEEHQAVVTALLRPLGEEYVVLFRKHPQILDGLPPEGAASVLDVSDFPDLIELLLVADALVGLSKRLGVPVPEVPAALGRPGSTPPQLVDEYRRVVLQSAKDVAAAADDTSQKESAAVGEIERALAG